MQWRRFAATIGVLLASASAAKAQDTITVDVVAERTILKNKPRADSILNAIRTYSTFNNTTHYVIRAVHEVPALPQKYDSLMSKVDSLRENRSADHIIILKEGYMDAEREKSGSGGTVIETFQRFGALWTRSEGIDGPIIHSGLVLTVPKNIPEGHIWPIGNYVHTVIAHETAHRWMRLKHLVVSIGVTNSAVNFSVPRQRRPYNPVERNTYTNPEAFSFLSGSDFDANAVRDTVGNDRAFAELMQGHDADAQRNYAQAISHYEQGLQLATHPHVKRELCQSLFQYMHEGRTIFIPQSCIADEILKKIALDRRAKRF